jgi:hypothetical protein
MNPALLLEIGISVVLATSEPQQFLVTVLIHALQDPRQPIPILAIVATDSQEMPTERGKAFP